MTTTADHATGLLSRYGPLLPLTGRTPELTLHEGNTPLIRADRLARWVGVETLYLKCEGYNPSGSFKDRGMVVAVAKAVEHGASVVLCASTGNTAASAAAYAARAGIGAVVLLPRGQVALGKLGQARLCGARVVSVDGNFDTTLVIARTLADRCAVTLVNSVNPYRIEGQATAAYEICETLGAAPEVLALPVGNGGNITAYWRGFQRYHTMRRITTLPRLLGVQAAGAAPLVRGAPVERPDTIATAIRIGNPASWTTAVEAQQASGGAFLTVKDAAILEAYVAIGSLEGVCCRAGVGGQYRRAPPCRTPWRGGSPRAVRRRADRAWPQRPRARARRRVRRHHRRRGGRRSDRRLAGTRAFNRGEVTDASRRVGARDRAGAQCGVADRANLLAAALRALRLSGVGQHENHTPIGSFKIRGAIVYVDMLQRSVPRPGGVVACSKGNFGQGIAYAARRAGMSAVVVVPNENSHDKNAAMRGLGADVLHFGDDFEESYAHAVGVAEERGTHMAPSYHPLLTLGIASYGLELFRAVRDLDTVYVPIGQGSGISGVIAARDALGLSTEVVGVVSERLPAYALSYERGVPDHDSAGHIGR